MTSPIDVLMILTAAAHNIQLQNKWELCVQSLLRESSVPVRLHLVGDADSRLLVTSRLLPDRVRPALSAQQFDRLTLVEHDMAALSAQVDEQLGDQLIRYFRYSAGSYYGHNLFFISIVAHRLFYPSVTRLVQLDADLKFVSDIAELWDEFDRFGHGNVMGIAHEQQPVYRHVFSAYRSADRHTRIGGPPPDGVTGFNSGVLLLDLAAMAHSLLYNQLINADAIKLLVNKYKFQGHLGDQDFYTLLSTDHWQLFHVLHCGFNRQLCRWWESHGYADVFDLYHACSQKTKIYHGNCNTPIPA